MSNKFEKALEYYQYVLDNYPVNDTTLEAWKGTAIANIGLNQDEQVDAAVKTLMAEFADHPGLSQAVFNIGEEYYSITIGMAKQGEKKAVEENLAKALTIWQKIVDELPKSKYTPRAHFFVGDCYYRMGEYTAAVTQYNKIATRYPDYVHAGMANYRIGKCYAKLKQAGNLPAAQADVETRSAYQKILQRYPNSASAKVARQWLKQHNQ